MMQIELSERPAQSNGEKESVERGAARDDRS